MDSENESLRKENTDVLIFEEHPNENPNKVAFILTAGIILVILLALFYFKSHKTTDLLLSFIIWLIFILFFLIYAKIYTVKVKIDKAANEVSITNLIPIYPPFRFYGTNLVHIPLRQIERLKYSPWSPLTPYTSIISRGIFVFTLKDNSEVKLYTWGLLVSYKRFSRIGKKIADFINVPFEID